MRKSKWKMSALVLHTSSTTWQMISFLPPPPSLKNSPAYSQGKILCTLVQKNSIKLHPLWFCGVLYLLGIRPPGSNPVHIGKNVRFYSLSLCYFGSTANEVCDGQWSWTSLFLHIFSCPVVLGLYGKVLVAGGLRDSFCENLLEASTMSNRANARQLQGGPTTDQVWAHQWQQ